MNKNRIDYIDIYKGIGIILMIMGHVGLGNVFDKFIHAFNMPMFFFISGYFFNEKRNFKINLIKIIKKLLVPYLFIGIFYYIIYVLINKDSLISNQLKSLFWNNTELPIGGAIWFLTALFWVELLYNFITYNTNKKIRTFAVLVFVFLGVFWANKLSFRLPLALDVSLVAIGFYHLGYILKLNLNNVYIKKILNLNIYWIIVLGLLNLVIIFNNGYVNMRTVDYANIILNFSGALLSILILLNISKLMDNIIAFNYLKKELIFIGKYSIIYLCLNQFLLMVSLKLENILEINPNFTVIRYINIIFILAILHILCLFFNMNKFKIVFGLK